MVRDEGDEQAAADLYLKAAHMRRDCVPLAVECCQALYKAQRYDVMLEFLEDAPAGVLRNGRVGMLRSLVALERNDLDTVAQFFTGDIDASNMREGEVGLSDILVLVSREARLGRGKVPDRRRFPPAYPARIPAAARV